VIVDFEIAFFSKADLLNKYKIFGWRATKI
jgi:hypothetical protein